MQAEGNDIKTRKRHGGRRPRLLYVLGDSKFGGGSVIVSRLAETARRRGYEVAVLTTDPRFQSMLRTAGLGVVELNCVWRETSLLRDAFGLLRLWKFLRDNRYDLVHTHTSKAGLVGRLAARAARVPAVVHTVHGFPFNEESGRGERLVYSAVERLAAHLCDRLVTVSRYHRDWAMRLRIGGASKVSAIPNGLDPWRVRPTRGRAGMREELGADAETLLVFAHGPLSVQKGFEYLIRAVPELKYRLDPTRLLLVFAGTGRLAGNLEDLALELGVRENIRFLGFRPDVGDLLAAADLVVLPSLWEGLSISLLEAMAAGKAVVTTNIGSNVEATDGGRGAVLVPPKDSAALAAAVVELASRPALARDLAKQAGELFQARYTEGRMLDDYARLYSELLDGADDVENE